MHIDLDLVARRLRAELEPLTDVSTDEVLRRIAPYRAMPVEILAEAFRYNTGLAINTIAGNAVSPDTRTSEQKFAILKSRLGYGLHIEDLIRAYRINLSVVHQRFMELANELGVGPEMTRAGSILLWELDDAFMSSTIDAYQRLISIQAVRTSLERADLVRGLLFGQGVGGVDPERLRSAGISSGTDYAAVIATPTDGDLERLTSRLGQFGSTDTARAVVTQISGRCVGLVARIPRDASGEARIALGTWGPLEDLPSSTVFAEAVWSVVSSFPSGVHDVTTQTWRIAVSLNPVISEHLRAVYIAPLDPETETGNQVLETLDAFLTHERSVRQTAEALFVHQNTVRYRLARFEAQTGRSTTRTMDLVELAWALESERQRRRFTKVELGTGHTAAGWRALQHLPETSARLLGRPTPRGRLLGAHRLSTTLGGSR